MKTKRLLSMFLTLLMVLGLGVVTASAEGEPTYSLDKASLTKDFQVADGVDISSFNTFTFSFTAGSSDTAAEGDHPAIANQTITVGTQSGDHAYGSLTLDNVFKIDDFKHAGEYVYTVEEAPGSNNKITYDNSKYTLRLYVTNGDNGLEFSGVTVENADGEKVDPIIKDGDNTSDFNFENTYKEDFTNDDGILTVTKSVTGDYGDKTKTFPVTVQLTIPSTATVSDVNLASDSKGTLSGLTVTANLADGDSIIFSKLPAGTTFKVEETQANFYTGTISGDLVDENTFATGVDVTAASTGPIVDSNGKTVTITNNRDNVIPTGVIINNLPYILMVAVAVLGAVFIVLKKKRTNA